MLRYERAPSRPGLTAPTAEPAVRLGLLAPRSGLAMRFGLTPPIVDLAVLRLVDLAVLRLVGLTALRLGLAVPRLELTPPSVDRVAPRFSLGRDAAPARL